MKMISQLSETYKIPVLNTIRTDQIIGKAARLHKMVVDVDPKAKALEDYDAATTGVLEILNVKGYKTEPEHGESIAV
jgi:nitrogenase subunit NifH